MCTQEYTQFGVARIRHDDENYYIIVFAKGAPKVEGDVTLSVRQKDYVDNYLYYESKYITKKKNTGLVKHKRHGQIMGNEKGSGDPDIYENQTTMTKKEAAIYENVNRAFEMISPKKNGYVSRTYNIRNKIEKKEKRFEDDGKVIDKAEIKVIKDPFERRKERKKEEKQENPEKREKKEKPEKKENLEKKEKLEKREKKEKVNEQKIEIVEEKIIEKVEKIEEKKDK